MKAKTSSAKAPATKSPALKKSQLRDLAAKQADNVKGGAIKRTRRTDR